MFEVHKPFVLGVSLGLFLRASWQAKRFRIGFLLAIPTQTPHGVRLESNSNQSMAKVYLLLFPCQSDQSDTDLAMLGEMQTSEGKYGFEQRVSKSFASAQNTTGA